MRKSNPRNPRGRFGALRDNSASRSVRGQEARAEINDALARMEAEEAEGRELNRQLLAEAERYGWFDFRPLDEDDEDDRLDEDDEDNRRERLRQELWEACIADEKKELLCKSLPSYMEED